MNVLVLFVCVLFMIVLYSNMWRACVRAFVLACVCSCVYECVYLAENSGTS